MAEKLNNFFINAVPNLKIKIDNEIINGSKNICDPVVKAIKKFENHPSITKIKQNVNVWRKFEFSHISTEDMTKVVQNLDPSKTLIIIFQSKF